MCVIFLLAALCQLGRPIPVDQVYAKDIRGVAYTVNEMAITVVPSGKALATKTYIFNWKHQRFSLVDPAILTGSGVFHLAALADDKGFMILGSNLKTAFTLRNGELSRFQSPKTDFHLIESILPMPKRQAGVLAFANLKMKDPIRYFPAYLMEDGGFQRLNVDAIGRGRVMWIPVSNGYLEIEIMTTAIRFLDKDFQEIRRYRGPREKILAYDNPEAIKAWGVDPWFMQVTNPLVSYGETVSFHLVGNLIKNGQRVRFAEADFTPYTYTEAEGLNQSSKGLVLGMNQQQQICFDVEENTFILVSPSINSRQ